MVKSFKNLFQNQMAINFVCSIGNVGLNIFYCISKQRDWTQVITALDSPFPNITTDYISYKGGYNNVNSIHIQSHIYSGTTAAEIILQRRRVDRHVNHSNLCESLMNLIAN